MRSMPSPRRDGHMAPDRMASSDAEVTARGGPGFPAVRPRRLRRLPLLRAMVRETELSPDDFILPLFVRPGRGVRQEIGSMPGQFQLSVDRLAEEVAPAAELGIRAFLLFGIPEHKDATGT